MPLTAPRAKSSAAAAIVRAALIDDIPAGVLVITQSGGNPAGAAGERVRELVLSMAGVGVRAVLAANGGDVKQTLAMLDRWIEEYARQAEVLGL